MEEDTKRRFKEEFDETVHDVRINFGKSEDIARLIVGTVICNTLKKLQIDTDELLFIEYDHTHYRKLRAEAVHREARRSVPFQIKICFSSNFTSR